MDTNYRRYEHLTWRQSLGLGSLLITFLALEKIREARNVIRSMRDHAEKFCCHVRNAEVREWKSILKKSEKKNNEKLLDR